MGIILQRIHAPGSISLPLSKGIICAISFSLILPLLLCFFLYLSPLPRSAMATEQIDFFYFNPDSVQSNFSLLTKEIDHFFTSKGYQTHFQAFSQQSDFDLLLATRRPALVLVPAWYFEQFGNEVGLTPLLTPLNGDKASYTKVLLERSKSINDGGLTGKTVAVTSMGINTDQQLTLFFNNGRTFDFANSHLIITPKDADALYALALGQVDLAVVGRNTMEAVGAVNKNILEAVEEVAPSKPVPMPLLCTLNGTMNREEITSLKQIFLSTADRQPLPEFMAMLQFNGWQNAML
jgi:ABC-type amino acid transport substrate-binding protein